MSTTTPETRVEYSYREGDENYWGDFAACKESDLSVEVFTDPLVNEWPEVSKVCGSCAVQHECLVEMFVQGTQGRSYRGHQSPREQLRGNNAPIAVKIARQEAAKLRQ